MSISIFNAGNIELSGKVVIADPCFERLSEHCIATDIAVKQGTYAAYIAKKYVNGWGTRAAAVMVIHTDYLNSIKEKWDPYGRYVFVDSGQCGIFDDAVYPAVGEPSGDWCDEEFLFGECCSIILSRKPWGILRSGKGVVSSSGAGDGSYEVFCQYHAGERIALMIDFDLARNVTVMRKLLKFYSESSFKSQCKDTQIEKEH